MSSRRAALQRIGALVLCFGAMHRAWGATIIGVRVWPADDYTRVTLESDQALSARHQLLQNPPRLLIDVDGLTLDPALRELVGKVRSDDPYIAGVRVGQNAARVVRLVLDLKQPVLPQQFALEPVAAYQQPVTALVDLAARSGGNAFSTYTAVPQYLTSRMRSVFLENSEYSLFDLRSPDGVQISTFAPRLSGRILYGADPEALIYEYTQWAGRMRAGEKSS